MGTQTVTNETIKKTQSSLKKLVKKPPITDKLLQRPPFRFLHDVICGVMQASPTCMKGLLSEAEMNLENIVDKQAKQDFLDKVISCVSFSVGQELTVNPADIVAGHGAQGTNELLQLIAKIAQEKTDTSKAVKKVAEGYRVGGRRIGGAGKQEKKGKDKEVKKEKEDKRVERDHKKDRDKDRQHDSREKERKVRDKHKDETKEKERKDVQKEKERGGEHDKEKDRDRDKHRDRDKERHKDRDKERRRTVVKEKDKDKDADYKTKENKAAKSHKERTEEEKDHKNEQSVSLEVEQTPATVDVEPTSNIEKKLSSPPGLLVEGADGQRDEEPEPEQQQVTVPSPVSVAEVGEETAHEPGSPDIPLAEASVLGGGKEEVDTLAPRVEVKGKISTLALARESEQQGVQLILEQDDHEGSEAEFVDAGGLDLAIMDRRGSYFPPETGGHGALVQGMMEQRDKAVSSPEPDATGKSPDRQIVQREVEALQGAVQRLCGAANPLGKNMAYIQEDMDTMQRELEGWAEDNKCQQAALHREEEVTRQVLEPLKGELTELEQLIAEQKLLIASCKARIIGKDVSILRMLSGVTGGWESAGEE